MTTNPHSLSPHDLLIEYTAEALGRRMRVFEDFSDEFFRPFLLGLTDQLSIYYQIQPFARLRLGEVVVREGRRRSYALIGITDRGGPLHLRTVTQRWDMQLKNDTGDFVGQVNGRRWHFLDRHLHELLGPLLRQVADRMATYFAYRPYSKMNGGMVRFLEGIDQSYIAAEFDERQENPGPTDTAGGRYLIQ